jgi:hypothetical protein
MRIMNVNLRSVASELLRGRARATPMAQVDRAKRAEEFSLRLPSLYNDILCRSRSRHPLERVSVRARVCVCVCACVRARVFRGCREL